MRIAAVDIGTNTARLLIADRRGGRSEDRVRRAVVTGLGRGVDRHGRFSAGPVARTLNVLRSFAEEIRHTGVDAARAVATSATRDAADGSEFLRRATDALGFRPEVLEGVEEAALAFAGATAGRSSTGRVLVVDVGGGSTELVLGRDRPEWVRSVDIGSVRLTERCLPRRPASAADLAAARAEVDRLLAPARPPAPAAEVIGVAGTVTSLAAMTLGLRRYDRDRVDGSRLRREDVERLIARLARLDLTRTAAIPSLDPARAPVILGGAVVVAETLAALDADALTVSEHDLLDGIVLTVGRERSPRGE